MKQFSTQYGRGPPPTKKKVAYEKSIEGGVESIKGDGSLPVIKLGRSPSPLLKNLTRSRGNTGFGTIENAGRAKSVARKNYGLHQGGAYSELGSIHEGRTAPGELRRKKSQIEGSY
jgi:hypothetical protein